MDKAHFLFHHNQSSIYKIDTLPKTTIFQINSQSFKQIPIIRWYLEFEIKIKNKKKRAKISSRFTKKQVQALRVFEKISTHPGSIFSKKPAFLKPYTWTNGFLFFFFFFWKIFWAERSEALGFFNRKPAENWKVNPF